MGVPLAGGRGRGRGDRTSSRRGGARRLRVGRDRAVGRRAGAGRRRRREGRASGAGRAACAAGARSGLMGLRCPAARAGPPPRAGPLTSATRARRARLARCAAVSRGRRVSAVGVASRRRRRVHGGSPSGPLDGQLDRRRRLDGEARRAAPTPSPRQRDAVPSRAPGSRPPAGGRSRMNQNGAVLLSPSLTAPPARAGGADSIADDAVWPSRSMRRVD